VLDCRRLPWCIGSSEEGGLWYTPCVAEQLDASIDSAELEVAHEGNVILALFLGKLGQLLDTLALGDRGVEKQ